MLTNEQLTNIHNTLRKQRDEREKKGGWGPGLYTSRCRACGGSFIGVKRASECADCACSYKEDDFKMIGNELVEPTKEQREWLEVEALNTTESHATIIRKLIQEKINND